MKENTQPDVNPQQNTAGSVQDITFRYLGQALALTVSAAYLCGFIVTTAHLGRFGFREYDAFRMQYLVAGVMVCVVGGVFAYFVGRHLTRFDTDCDEYIKLFERLGGTGRGWAIWAFIYALLENVYFVWGGTAGRRKNNLKSQISDLSWRKAEESGASTRVEKERQERSVTVTQKQSQISDCRFQIADLKCNMRFVI